LAKGRDSRVGKAAIYIWGVEASRIPPSPVAPTVVAGRWPAYFFQYSEPHRRHELASASNNSKNMLPGLVVLGQRNGRGFPARWVTVDWTGADFNCVFTADTVRPFSSTSQPAAESARCRSADASLSHGNAFYFSKLEKMLRQAGFSRLEKWHLVSLRISGLRLCHERATGPADVPEFARCKCYSLYVEAFK
jgi:hypothetical protein